MYCTNNPVMYIDENGDAWWKKLLTILAIVVVVSAVIALTVATAGVAATAIAAGIGATVGALSYSGSVVVTGITTGEWSWSWGDFLGSTLGGAIAGMIGIIPGVNTAFSAGFGASISSIFSDGFNYVIYDTNKSFKDVIKSAVITGVITFITAGVLDKVVLVKGLNTGRGSFSQVSSQIYTKLNNGTILRITGKTFAKMLTLELYYSSLDWISSLIRG